MGEQYVGIDLHRRRLVIVRMTGEGEVLETVRIDNDPVALSLELAKAGPDPEVVLEATYGWYWAADLLQACGARVHLAHPLGVKMFGYQQVKTDARDSTNLAELLRMDRLPEAWLAPAQVRELRELVRYRAKLVALRSGLKAQVHVYSVTKSVTSALIGIALGEHTLAGLDQPVGRLLATHLPPKPDPRIRAVTVEQLLTMTAGLPPDPTDGAPPSLVRATDWVRFVLSRHPTTTPGSRFTYSSEGSHLLSAIIADATGQPTLRYAQAKLFAPLGIASDHPFEPEFAPRNQAAYERAGFAWPTDPQGYHLGYGFLKLTARDLAKLGYLYLKGGTWEGRQVVPATYVRASTQTQVPTGGTFGPFKGYGYQWWTTTEQGHQAFAAIGLGGQLIEVVPDLDLVVVMTSEPSTAAEVRAGGDSHSMVGNVVVPAVRD